MKIKNGESTTNLSQSDSSFFGGWMTAKDRTVNPLDISDPKTRVTQARLLNMGKSIGGSNRLCQELFIDIRR